MTTFLRLMDVPVDEKASALRELVHGRDASPRVFERDAGVFGAVPGSPFAYWVSDRIIARFVELPAFETGGRVARRTNGTTDDGRWIRIFWEVEGATSSWPPHAKGGAYSEFWSDLHLTIAWDAKRATYPGYLGTMHRPDVRPASLQYFFRPGLTWSRRTQKGFSMRAMPRGVIFGDKGPGCFTEGDSIDELLAALAIANSSTFRFLLSLQMAFGSYEAGVVQSTPYPVMQFSDRMCLSQLARRAWSLKRSLDTRNETSHAFLLPPGLNERVTNLNPAAVEAELASIEQQINKIAFELYGIGDDDRRTIEAASKKRGATSTAEDTDNEADDEDEDGGDTATDEQANERRIENSWMVGVAFGRFDKRLATGEREIPPEPEPFDPLPSRSPGMWPEGEGFAKGPADVLVDDPGHPRDIFASLVEASSGTGIDVPHETREWLAKEFFAAHIKMYSKSRRKAPIYWQLATPSAKYSVWIYLHAFSKDTIYRIQNDYVAPKIVHEQQRLESMRRDPGDGTKAAQQKRIAAQEAFVEELRTMEQEIKKIAPLWNPTLDDGVVINFSLLWRLVGHHKPWQKELRATWDALSAGEFDWAHLAMHLWPERVVPKCQTDRSLAIAHGLEETFWVEGADGKWKARATPLRAVEEIVEERRSTAVKEALRGLAEEGGMGVGHKKGKGAR